MYYRTDTIECHLFSVIQFFEALLSIPLLDAIKPLKTSVFLLVCGALASSKHRMREVKQMASKFVSI